MDKNKIIYVLMENWLINDKLFEILSYEIRRKYNDVIFFVKC